MNIKNIRTGVVHELDGYIAVCGANFNSRSSNPHNVFREEDENWQETDQPTNCKRCLKMINNNRRWSMGGQR